MNREIKFRGLKDNGEWIKGDLVNSFEGVHIVSDSYFKPSNDDSPLLISVKSESVGQYIGLKDMSGAEIYEGDIYEMCGSKYQIIFDNGCFCVNRIGFNNPCPINWCPENEDDCKVDNFSSKILVIGNIHQNPELL